MISSDGYNYFRFITPGVQDIIYDNFYIHLFYIYGKFESFTGTYITKKEIYKQEKLIWKIRYGFPLDPRQEVVRLMYINKDNLETINQVKENLI